MVYLAQPFLFHTCHSKCRKSYLTQAYKPFLTNLQIFTQFYCFHYEERETPPRVGGSVKLNKPGLSGDGSCLFRSVNIIDVPVNHLICNNVSFCPPLIVLFT